MPQPPKSAPPIPTPAVVVAEPIEAPPVVVPRPTADVTTAAATVEDVRLSDTEWPHRVGAFHRIRSVAEWLFGALSLIGILAVLATIPVLQFLSLGYLLEVSGRVARGGRLRDGFFGVRKAARVGSIVLGTWLLLLPLRFVAELWYTAKLIDPDSNVTQGWGAAMVVLTVLIVGQILWAWYRGGRLRHFFWPAPIQLVRSMFRGGKYVQARDAFWDFVVGLRLPYYFWLGLRGFIGALIWLVWPVTLLALASRLPQGAAVVTGLFGGILLAIVLLYLPFLQANFAAKNRLGAMFHVRTVRRMFQRAPIAFWLALLVTLLFALPLYLLKVELTPSEVAWLPSLAFVVFIFPARLLTGWALARAQRREGARMFVSRWAARLAALPVVAFYALIVYFTQYLSWYGAYSLYEQHAFLVPVPFLGL